MSTAHLQAGQECMEAGIDYLSRGWSALIVCPPDHVGVRKTHAKGCSSPGKAPFGPWKEFQDRLPTEQELRDKWRALPNGNVGVALGPVSGLVGIDVDGAGGERRLLEISGGDLPATLEFRTAGGGRRPLYRIPARTELRTTYERPGGPREELRFQAKGSQTVMPPSRHKNGGRYAWVPGRGPGEIEAAGAPAWLVEQLRADGPAARKQSRTVEDGELITEGHRNTMLTSFAGTMRRRGMSEASILAALLVENSDRCDPPLAEGDVEGIAASIGRYKPSDLWLAGLARGRSGAGTNAMRFTVGL